MLFAFGIESEFQVGVVKNTLMTEFLRKGPRLILREDFSTLLLEFCLISG